MMTYEYISKYNANNVTKGRPWGIKSITIHHWDDPNKNPKFQGIIDWFASPNNHRNSAHYVVEGGRVACLVDPDDRAWHAGHGLNQANGGNATSIGIECNPRCSSEDLETVAELIADLRRVYGNLPLYPHDHWHSTSCPGRYRDKLAWLSMRADEILKHKPASQAPTVKKTAPAAPAPSIDQLAKDTIAGKFGNGDERRRRLGSNYDAVQKRVNEMLQGSKSGHPSANIDDLARRVIRGEFGNGDERRRRLGSNYDAVQKRVNQLLK